MLNPYSKDINHDIVHYASDIVNTYQLHKHTLSCFKGKFKKKKIEIPY